MWPWQEILGQLDACRRRAAARRSGRRGRARARAVHAVPRGHRRAGRGREPSDRCWWCSTTSHATDPGALLLARLRRPITPAVPRPARRDVPSDGRRSGGHREALVSLLDEGTTVEVAALDVDALASLLDWAGEGAEQRIAPTELLELSGGNPLLALELVNALGDPQASSRRMRQPVAPVASCRRGSRRSPRGRARARRRRAARSWRRRRRWSLRLPASRLASAEAVRRRGIEAGVLRRSGDGFVFSHGLLREALLDSIPTRTAVDAARPRGRRARRAAIAAHHRPSHPCRSPSLVGREPVGRAGSRGDCRRGRRDSRRGQGGFAPVRLRSRRRAARVCAAAARSHGPADPPRRLLLELAQMELASGRLMQRARDIRPGTPHGGRRSRSRGLCRGRHRPGRHLGVRAPRAGRGCRVPRRVADAHSTHVSDARPDLAVRIRARLGAEELYMGTGALDGVLEAVDDARSLGEPTALVRSVVAAPPHDPRTGVRRRTHAHRGRAHRHCIRER